jgi:hypothetical protein
MLLVILRLGGVRLSGNVEGNRIESTLGLAAENREVSISFEHNRRIIADDYPGEHRNWARAFRYTALGFFVQGWEHVIGRWEIGGPFWFFIATLAAFSAAPWIHWRLRFSLRALLITMAVVAMLLVSIMQTARYVPWQEYAEYMDPGGQTRY